MPGFEPKGAPHCLDFAHQCKRSPVGLSELKKMLQCEQGENWSLLVGVRV